MLDGFVIDDSGRPVEGIAVKLGKTTTWSDCKGYVRFYAKHTSKEPFEVVLSDSVAPGRWKVRESYVNSNATAGKQIAVVVERVY